MLLVVFFFSSRRRHTRFKCDWSSDVCSSDLADQNRRGIGRACRLSRFERLPAHRECPMSRPKIAALIIFDGWGLREAREANAILKARTPTMNRLTATQAHTEIDASGESVGLLPGVMGNSEDAHLTIGAGRVIYQDVMRITKAIETGALFRNEVLLKAMRAAAQSGRTLHLCGLLSAC